MKELQEFMKAKDCGGTKTIMGTSKELGVTSVLLSDPPFKMMLTSSFFLPWFKLLKKSCWVGGWFLLSF